MDEHLDGSSVQLRVHRFRILLQKYFHLGFLVGLKRNVNLPVLKILKALLQILRCVLILLVKHFHPDSEVPLYFGLDELLQLLEQCLKLNAVSYIEEFNLNLKLIVNVKEEEESLMLDFNLN